jgi:hypothetical protein
VATLNPGLGVILRLALRSSLAYLHYR